MTEIELELQRLDDKLRSWLVEGPEGPPESPAEEELLQHCIKAKTDAVAKFYVASICINRALYQQARVLLEQLLKLEVQDRKLLQLNCKFHLGVIQFDNLCDDADEEAAECEGFRLMEQVADTDSVAFHNTTNTPFVKGNQGMLDADTLVVNAQYNVGRAFLLGQGAVKDDDVGVEWLLKAARDGAPAGSPQAMCELGHFYSDDARRLKEADPLHLRQPDYKEAYSWHAFAAKNGSVDSMAALGLLLRDGKGCKQDTVTALKWLRSAADLGHDVAETELGIHYFNMRLYNKAVQWLRRVVDPLLDLTQDAIEDMPARMRTARARACWYTAYCLRQGLGDAVRPDQPARALELAVRLDKAEAASLQKMLASW